MELVVYHASHRDYDVIEPKKFKAYRDFGKGFYVTEHEEDSISILKGLNGYIYQYKLRLDDSLNILEFGTLDEWFDYIYLNRTEDVLDDLDVVYGHTASGKCSKLFKDIRNKKESICKKELLNKIYSKSFKNQYCIKSIESLSNLELINKRHITFD